MRVVHVGIIGCGVVSRFYFKHIKAYYRWLNIAACADLMQEKAEQAATAYGIPKACTPEELLRDPQIEIVINLTQPQVHTEVNRQILLAGKHVYCEKPLATNLEDATEVMKLAKEKGLRVACAPETVLSPGVQTARRLLEENHIGKPVWATVHMVSPGVEIWHANPAYYYQPGGGPVLDMGAYYLSAMVFMFGAIEKVSAVSTRAADTRPIYSPPLRGKMMPVEVDTTYAGTLQFKCGVIAGFTMSFDGWRSHLPQFEVYGTDGTLTLPDPNMCGGEFSLFRKERILDHLDEARNVGNAKPMEQLDLYEELSMRYPMPEIYSRGLGVLDLAFALVNGRPHRASAELAYHTTEVMLGILQAAEQGNIYTMHSCCEPPALIPEGLPLGELD